MASVTFRCSGVEKAAFVLAAGGSLSAWIVGVLNDQLALDAALEVQGAGEGALAGRVGAVQGVAYPEPEINPSQEASVMGADAREFKSRRLQETRPASVPSIPGVTTAARLPANFCKRTGLERGMCLCPDCKR